MELANADILFFEEDRRAIELSLFTEEGYMIQQLVGAVYVSPSLEGSKIDHFEMHRRYNLIGGVDYLDIYVPPLQVSVFVAADLIVELPHGIAYSLGDDMVCIRTLDNGREVELPYEAQHAATVSPRMLGILEEIVGADDDEMTLDEIDQIFSVGLPVAVVDMTDLAFLIRSGRLDAAVLELDDCIFEYFVKDGNGTISLDEVIQAYK